MRGLSRRVERLQINPALCIVIEISGQTQRGIDGYAALSLDDCMGTAGRNINGVR